MIKLPTLYDFPAFFFLLSVLAAITIVVPVQPRTAPSDISALKDIKASITRIRPSSCLASWVFSNQAADPCSAPFCGIVCDETSTRVTQLNLTAQHYHGTLSPSVSNLTHLQVLDLSYNSFKGSIPSLSSLSKLQTLSLPNNSFSGPVPTSIPDLKYLQYLDISANNLSGSLPNRLSSLLNLTILDLSSNSIGGTIPSNLTTLPRLMSLSLSQNNLTGPIPPGFEKMKNLRRLSLDGNFLTGTPPHGLLSAMLSGSIGDNCLQNCTQRDSRLCVPKQKDPSKCPKTQPARAAVGESFGRYWTTSRA